jgi:hypothetical protein
MSFARVAVLAAALMLFGCSTRHTVTRPGPVTPEPPVADSPANALRRFEWAWDHRDTLILSTVLADDFRFAFANGDSAGGTLPGGSMDRTELLCTARNLFVGGGSEPPATNIVLDLDSILVSLPDSRAGMAAGWHREILSGVDLTIQVGSVQQYRVMGSARFFVVRGDSVAIPAGLAARVAVPDSTRWYLQQWDDATLAGGSILRAVAARPQPSGSTTWGQILALYRCE